MPVQKQHPSRALIPALAALLCALLTGCATTHLTVDDGVPLLGLAGGVALLLGLGFGARRALRKK